MGWRRGLRDERAGGISPRPPATHTHVQSHQTQQPNNTTHTQSNPTPTTQHDRYTKLANWDYVQEVAQSQDPALPRVPVIGNGDVLSWEDHEAHKVRMGGGGVGWLVGWLVGWSVG